MSRYPALDGLRIGCVQYLNAKPLICGFDGPTIFDHPAKLAAALAAGELDAALVPSFELLRAPGYQVVDGVSISSRGPVYSVFLAYHGALSDIRGVHFDPASLTSANLVRCVLAEFHGVNLQGLNGNGDAQLLIGNQAIDFRRQDARGWQILDLGEEWTNRTGLPFVYALWLLRPGLENAADVAESLRALKREGLGGIPAIAESHADPDFCRRYLTENIRYDFGAGEKAGLRKFESSLVHLHLLGRVQREFDFV